MGSVVKLFGEPIQLSTLERCYDDVDALAYGKIGTDAEKPEIKRINPFNAEAITAEPMAKFAHPGRSGMSFGYAGIDRCMVNGDDDIEEERRLDLRSREIPATYFVRNFIR